MSVVRIPPTLRAEAGGHRDVEVAAATVRDALAALVDSYPALQERLPGDGRLPAFVNLYVDGKDVRELAGLETPLEPGSTLLLLPAMAGGELATPLVVDVRVDQHGPRETAPIVWTFSVRNPGPAPCKLGFLTAQQGDISLRAAGVEKHRWSDGKAFAAVVSERTLAPGDAFEFSLADTIALEAGTYEFVASVTARPALPVVRGELTVGGA